jgi:hypothetical protein
MDAGDEALSHDQAALARSNNWTIKSVPLETRLRAVNAAKIAGVSVAAWLAQAVDLLAERQAGNAILPPPREAWANPPANPQANNTTGQSKLGPNELAGLMQAAAALATATGIKPTVRDMRRAYGLLDEMVRVTRGLGPRPNMRHRLGIMHETPPAP